MNAKKAKQLRRLAERYTSGAPNLSYHEGKTARLAECTRGAYQALKSGEVARRVAI